MTAALHFDEDRHAYTLDGVPVPGVTTALKVVSSADYAMVDPAVLERAAALGTAVHRVIELDIRGTLDTESLDPQLVPYYGLWREFLATSGFRPIAAELRVASRRYGYAGTLDTLGMLHGELALLDLKRVVRLMRSTGPQTAGYELALREWRPDLVPEGAKLKRYALQLTDRWNLHPLKDPRDARTFLAALTCHQFMNPRSTH